MTMIIVICILTTLVFAFINGFHDGCNVIATIISSRSIEPKKAIITAVAVEFLGPLFMGTAVAQTLGNGVIDQKYLTGVGNAASTFMVISALFGSIVWNLITWKYGLPSSSSHALIGGLLGAGIAAYGPGSIQWFTVTWKVIFILLATPLIGFAAGYVLLKLNKMVFKNFPSRINVFFKKIQMLSMIFLALSHSTSDSQKSMAIITMLLLINGLLPEFKVPLWVMIVCTMALSAGLATGGWSIIKTVGTRIYKVKPIHSFSSHISASAVIITASLLGSPVSTTQIVSSSIMGVGAADNFKNVRWDTVKSIMVSWIITIPTAALVASGIFRFVSIIAKWG